MNNIVNNKVEELLKIMAQLRDKETGCPWDLAQNFASIAPYTIEEAYEVADAIEQKNMQAIKDELGDLLFQVIFHSQLAKEQQAFEFVDVVQSICDKLTRRHPHVFDESYVAKGDLSKQWEAHKRAEKEAASGAGILDRISGNQPAMNHAYKLQKKAASVGFDWPEIEGVFDKLDEEIEELKVEVGVKNNAQRVEEELGDVLFSCINLARHLNVNPEGALRLANKRFSSRFSYIEETLRQSGEKLENSSLSVLDALWDDAKEATKNTET